MSVLSKLSPDGLAYAGCPKPDCGATLRVKPKSPRSNVNCAQCGHKFVLEVADLGPPSGAIIPPPVPKPAKETYSFRSDDEPAPPKRERSTQDRDRTRSRRRERDDDRRQAPVGLIVGGGLAALIVVGGIIFGVIAPNLIMTNAHVLSGRMLDEFRVSFVSLDETAPAPLKPTLLYIDNRRDIAILRVTTDRPPLEMVPSGTELQGMEVAIVGNPKGEAGQAQIN